MQILIKIPDDANFISYKYKQNGEVWEVCDTTVITLPKGHGRLIDVNQIVYEKECVYETDGCCTTRSTPDIDATPTIIEAEE